MNESCCAEAPAAANATASPARWLPRRLLSFGLALLLAWPAWFVGQVYLLGNVHEAIPGELYRGAQPSANSLANLIDRHQIRTVLNVRGCCYPDAWYVAEAAVCQERGVAMHDISFSAVHYPSRHELQRLIEVLDRAERPIFVHCRHGADRTGVASMAARLLLEDGTLSQARPQLGLRYGHAAIGKPATLDRFVQLYADWLSTSGVEHTPGRFRHWIANEYRGAQCDARFEKVERLFEEPRVGKALQYRVVVRNTSQGDWQFRALKTAGHHITFKVLDEAHQKILLEGRAGMFDRTVSPGATLEAIVIVPPMRKAGRYPLMIDMIEEGHCWFHQTGSEPWEEELMIRE